MATESIGQTVHLTNEMADRIIEAMEKVKANPPKPRTQRAELGDAKEFARLIEIQYGNAE